MTPRTLERTPRNGVAMTAVLCVVLLGGPLTVLAQEPSASPASAAPVSAADFAIPSDASLAADAAISVVDTPAPPPVAVDPEASLATLTAILDGLPAADWDVASLAATFEDDPERAFAFVRDAIGFDPYRGVLRGAEGTLAARAGSSADRALLLKALLDGMGTTSRFGFGELDAETAAALVERSMGPPAVPREGPSALAAIDPELARAAASRARRDHALLRAAIGESLTGTSAATEPTAEELVAHHTWVQFERDGQWVDLDSSMPDAQAGGPLVAAVSTADSIPLDERASVTFRVRAENLIDGVSQETFALDQTLDAAGAAEAQVILTFQPAGGGGGLLGGADLLGGGGGVATAYEPVLWVDDVSTVGTPIPVLPGDDPLGGGGDVRLTRVAIEVDGRSPGRDPVSSERVLLDRVPAELRSTGAWSADQLLPMPVAYELPAVMSSVHHVMVSTGGADPVDALESSIGSLFVVVDSLATDEVPEDLPLGALLLPLTSADAQIVLGSEHAVVTDLDASTDGRTFVGRPRIYLVSLGPDPVAPDGLELMTDLALDRIDVVPASGADPDAAARQRLWYGAAQTALETEYVLRGARGFDPSALRLTGVSLAMGRPLTVVTDRAEAAGAPERMLAAVDAGAIAIVPGDPVSSPMWWTVATDGETRSIVDPGVRAAGVGGFPLFWGADWDYNANNWSRWNDRTVIKRRCGGGQESQAVTNCASLNAIHSVEVQRALVRFLRAYAEYLRYFPPV